MRLMKSFFVILCLNGIVFSNQVLVNMPANSWYSAPDTKMRPVCSNSPILASKNCSKVMSAWCSAAYDPIHHEMICFGGGHGDYLGNEVYSFNVNTLTWQRLTEPSPGPFSQDPLEDGTASGRHTYDGLCYLDHAKRFFVFGGSLSGDGKGNIEVTWTFDNQTATWENNEPTNGTKHGGSGAGIHLTMRYHEKTRNIVLQAKGGTYTYNHDSNTWARVPGGAGAPGGDKTSTIDTKRDLMFTLGDGNWRVYDIMNEVDVTAAWETAKPTWCDDIAPGFAYDEKADKIIGWRGGNTMHVLDLDTKTWSTETTSGAPANAIGAGGIYGRFRYVPEYNAFILANHVDSNMAFYKYTAGTGTGKVEAASLPVPNLDVDIMPNPFNSAVSLRLTKVAGKGNSEIKFQIYNANGKLIKNFLPLPSPLPSRLVARWDATGHPSGIYLLRVKIGNRTIQKRLILAK